jgi:Tfp pilus assembly protein PilF
MSTNDLLVKSEVVQLLMEVGYVAVGRGLQPQADAIFEGVIAARPNSELPLIGLAVSKINFGALTEAAKILSERALAINPDSGMAKSFLAMISKSLGAKSEADDLARYVVETSDDPTAKALAESIISGVDIPK